MCSHINAYAVACVKLAYAIAVVTITIVDMARCILRACDVFWLVCADCAQCVFGQNAYTAQWIFGQNAYTALWAFCALRAMLFWPKCIYRAIGCFAYCAQCAFDRLRAMRFGDFGIECAYGAIYAKSIQTSAAGYAGKNLAML